MKTIQTKTYTCIDWYTWFLILIQVGNKSVVEKSCPKQPAILYDSRYSVPVYWCLWSLLNHVLIDFSNSTPGETGAGEEASPYSKVRMSDMHTLEHFRTGNLGATSHHFSLTDHAIPWDSSLFIRPRQAVIQSCSGRGESLGEGGTLLVAEAARRNEETTCITLVTLVRKITQYHPIYPYLNSIIVLQSFAKCYKQKVFRKLQAPLQWFLSFKWHYLPLVVSTLLVLRIKLWKLTEYRRIVYLEPHQQLNFCSFATKCTGAHDLHFVLTISPVILIWCMCMSLTSLSWGCGHSGAPANWWALRSPRNSFEDTVFRWSPCKSLYIPCELCMIALRYSDMNIEWWNILWKLHF